MRKALMAVSAMTLALALPAAALAGEPGGGAMVATMAAKWG